MLVLSRKSNQRIVFANLGISVEVLRVEGKTVRIGVDAPNDVRVLRGELINEERLGEMNENARQQRHELRNQLHTARLALHLLQKQLDVGLLVDAEQSLRQALESIAQLDQAVAGHSKSGHSKSGHSDRPSGVEQDLCMARRALVVEDNANERELLAGYLRLYGFEVDSVEDGVSALDYLSTHERPDAVLLDMQMPRMDGPATISAIRRDPTYRGIKLFAVSGQDRAALQVPLGDRGVNRWFEKPLNPVEFASELDAETSKRCSFA